MLLVAKQGTGLVTVTQLALGVLSLTHQEMAFALNFGFCLLDWNSEMGHYGKGKESTSLSPPKQKPLEYFRRTQILDSVFKRISSLITHSSSGTDCWVFLNAGEKFPFFLSLKAIPQI